MLSAGVSLKRLISPSVSRARARLRAKHRRPGLASRAAHAPAAVRPFDRVRRDIDAEHQDHCRLRNAGYRNHTRPCAGMADASCYDGRPVREDFRADIESVTETKPEERKSNAGRKPYDAILKFKIVVLQSLHNLSDEQTEYLIRDRLSFMRFLDLGLEDPVPDATTIWLFREALAQAGLIDKLFERFGQHLEAEGYIARGGQIIDATIVSVPKQRNTK